jgi:hypothetical protein
MHILLVQTVGSVLNQHRYLPVSTPVACVLVCQTQIAGTLWKHRLSSLAYQFQERSCATRSSQPFFRILCCNNRTKAARCVSVLLGCWLEPLPESKISMGLLLVLCCSRYTIPPHSPAYRAALELCQLMATHGTWFLSRVAVVVYID